MTLALTPKTIASKDQYGLEPDRQGRAGITPGFVAPVVSVMPKTAAQIAGIKTGEKITAVGWTTMPCRNNPS